MNIMSERETKKFGICMEDYRGDSLDFTVQNGNGN